MTNLGSKVSKLEFVTTSLLDLAGEVVGTLLLDANKESLAKTEVGACFLYLAVNWQARLSSLERTYKELSGE